MRLFTGKKSTSSAMLSCGYWKDIQTYFRYFGYTWLHTPKIIVSTCRRLWLLSSCQKYTSSFTSFFLSFILKNPVIWLADSILAHNTRLRYYQIWDWSWSFNKNTSFCLRLFPRKSWDKTFQNIQKTIFWGHFGPFLLELESR